jgi:hypothetical protein
MACTLVSRYLPSSSSVGCHCRCFTYHKECAALRTRTIPHDTKVVIAAAPNNLMQLCEPASLSTDFGLTQCQKFCDAAGCCWKDNIAATSSCVDNVNCPGYASCLNLKASMTNSTNIVKEVQSKCTIADLMAVGGKQACDSVCLQHNCCWDMINNTCFSDADCRQYDGCQLLNDLDRNGILDSTQVKNPATLFPLAGSTTAAPASAGSSAPV